MVELLPGGRVSGARSSRTAIVAPSGRPLISTSKRVSCPRPSGLPRAGAGVCEMGELSRYAGERAGTTKRSCGRIKQFADHQYREYAQSGLRVPPGGRRQPQFLGTQPVEQLFPGPTRFLHHLGNNIRHGCPRVEMIPSCNGSKSRRYWRGAAGRYPSSISKSGNSSSRTALSANAGPAAPAVRKIAGHPAEAALPRFCRRNRAMHGCGMRELTKHPAGSFSTGS